ncbi:hypothetical protein QMK33_05170 [Hymenobacter sp. H14-R3]|uniref:hypothetical protein n=1 Tax=Hymenobacter sp. H14-R3 TaxID=3046308 RepID=UPI0024B8C2C5|nr:hypothetical protein [Hymenobacter sp. H14-R3]MDJ0364534.1 hypothetical protein [Hymenobacter sp. H14-R3]
MQWRNLLLLFVTGLLLSTLLLGISGSFFNLLFYLKIVSLTIEFVAAVAPMWLLRRQLQRDIADPSGAFKTGMRWWLAIYVTLFVTICWLPWFRPFFIPKVPYGEVLLQYVLAACIAFLPGAVAFALKRFRYVPQPLKHGEN